MENILDKGLSVNLKLKELIVYYHQTRPVLKYSAICHNIFTIHNRSISVRQLRHFCQKLKLTRRCHVQDDLVKDIITNELSTSCSCLGQRQLSKLVIIKYNLTVSKDQVRKCLKVVDPEGVKKRWRKIKRRRIYETDGPGDAFHMDGNDRLKRWEFASSLDQLSQKERNNIATQNKFCQ